MNKRHLSEFRGGWIIGSFTPSLEVVTELEVCLKRYSFGEKEPLHHQREATEYTLVISGTCRIGNLEVGPNEIVCIPPGEAADFEALEDVVLVAIKSPSLPDDKVVGPASEVN